MGMWRTYANDWMLDTSNPCACSSLLLSYARDICDLVATQSDRDGVWGDDRVPEPPPASSPPAAAHRDPLSLRR